MFQNNYLKSQINKINKKVQDAKSLIKDPQLCSLAKSEIKNLEKEKKQILQLAKPRLSKSSIFNNCILEIRPATGGEEAKIWAHNLLETYTRFANSKNWKVVLLNNLNIKIEGIKAYETLKYESGVHRVQRIPKTESKGRIHTSTATVAVLPVVSKTKITINPKDIEFQAFHASSQGGQNVQKVATAVRLTHRPTGITVACQTQRYQEQNRKIALDLLRSRLWQKKEEKKQAKITNQRRQAIGKGMRSEKIRTYNFSQNRVTDHRLKKSWYNLSQVLNGQLDKIVKALSSGNNKFNF